MIAARQRKPLRLPLSWRWLESPHRPSVCMQGVTHSGYADVTSYPIQCNTELSKVPSVLYLGESFLPFLLPEILLIIHRTMSVFFDSSTRSVSYQFFGANLD